MSWIIGPSFSKNSFTAALVLSCSFSSCNASKALKYRLHVYSRDGIGSLGSLSWYVSVRLLAVFLCAKFGGRSRWGRCLVRAWKWAEIITNLTRLLMASKSNWYVLEHDREKSGSTLTIGIPDFISRLRQGARSIDKDHCGYQMHTCTLYWRRPRNQIWMKETHDVVCAKKYKLRSYLYTENNQSISFFCNTRLLSHLRSPPIAICICLVTICLQPPVSFSPFTPRSLPMLLINGPSR